MNPNVVEGLFRGDPLLGVESKHGSNKRLSLFGDVVPVLGFVKKMIRSNLNLPYLTFRRISSSDAPPKGGYPHRRMNRMTPQDQTSHF